MIEKHPVNILESKDISAKAINHIHLPHLNQQEPINIILCELNIKSCSGSKCLFLPLLAQDIHMRLLLTSSANASV